MFVRKCYFLLIFIFVIKTSNSEHFQTQILEARQLYPYRAYKDVQIFHYTVPPQVSQAVFHYKANGSVHCAPKPVAIYLQYGSFPVMSVRGTSFPELFVVKRLFLHNITLLTDVAPVTLNVSNPMPGNWFAAAFLLESSERIAQKGLFTPCSGWLWTSLKLQISDDITTLLSQSQSSELISSNQIYRFFANDDAWSSDIQLKDCNYTNGRCPVIILAQPNGLPSLNYSTFVDCSKMDNCIVNFVPAVNSWNYFSIQNLQSSDINFTLHVRTDVCSKQQDVVYLSAINSSISAEFVNGSSDQEILSESVCWANIPLIRVSMPMNLAYEYNLPQDEDESYPLILNITNSGPTFTSFEVQPTTDIGGTLVVELAISPFMNLSLSNVSVISCLGYGVRPKPGVPMYAKFCGSSIQLSVNTSSWESRITTTLIPFPEAGTWYITLLPQCFIIDTSTNTTEPVSCELTYTPIFLRIRSAPCVLGQCGEYGGCYQYVSGGFIFSTCNCIAGWKGWTCSDGTTAQTYAELLCDVLLLTLSNILFIPAIVLGIYRRYFTEALVYFSTMFFSAFYHACEGVIYSYCLMRLPILQFCDFYSAILSIWVTLIALAGLPHKLQSVAHMAGAIGVALGVKYDKTSLWVIVFPAGIGSLIMFTSWASRCYKNTGCYPQKKVWLFNILPSAILAFIGVLMFVLFETHDNYPYVHSAWHGLIALSVLFALPKRQIEEKDAEINGATTSESESDAEINGAMTSESESDAKINGVITSQSESG